MKATKAQLIERVKKIIELPGICLENHRKPVLEFCETLSSDELCKVLVLLRLRCQTLLDIVRSPEKIQDIKTTAANIKNFLKKYDL